MSTFRRRARKALSVLMKLLPILSSVALVVIAIFFARSDPGPAGRNGISLVVLVLVWAVFCVLAERREEKARATSRMYQVLADGWRRSAFTDRAALVKARESADYWRSSAAHADRDRREAERATDRVVALLDLHTLQGAGFVAVDDIRQALDGVTPPSAPGPDGTPPAGN